MTRQLRRRRRRFPLSVILTVVFYLAGTGAALGYGLAARLDWAPAGPGANPPARLEARAVWLGILPLWPLGGIDTPTGARVVSELSQRVGGDPDWESHRLVIAGASGTHLIIGDQYFNRDGAEDCVRRLEAGLATGKPFSLVAAEPGRMVLGLIFVALPCLALGFICQRITRNQSS